MSRIRAASGSSGGSNSGVTSLNGLTGAIDIVAGTSNVLITESGNEIIVSVTGTGTGNVTGIPPTTIDAIAIWATTDGTEIQNSETLVQASGAIEAQAYITRRDITGLVTVNPDETWIAPNIELSLGGAIIISDNASIIIV
jgi:hypothetical protein